MLSLVLGLGNIGERYGDTRHNLGFRVIESVLAANEITLQPGTCDYDWATKKTEVFKVVFARPRTYMNNCGIAARALLQKHDLEPSQMLVVADDFNLPLGRIRIRKFGSDGGHNGLASIIEGIGTDDFPRMRLGIGLLPDDIDAVDYVLSGFNKEETEPVEKMIAVAAEAVMFTIGHGLDGAMTKYNADPA